MSEHRQQTFTKLKPPCVNLSSVALKFRIQDATVKDVLRALEQVRDILHETGKNGELTPQLAEYALFPLVQQVFNETKRLSPRCLETAVMCVTILVSHGYRQALAPKLGRELLILMLMLAGTSTDGKSQAPPDELKVATFNCILETVKALKSGSGSRAVLEDQGAKNVVDPLVYLLLEGVTDSQPEQVQMAASEALLQLIRAINSRVFLASLLPRTVSSITKALRPSTTAKRTKKVLTSNLRVLRLIIDRTLADRVATDLTNAEEKEALGESWLKATSAQIKNALVQIVKLRNHESAVVHRALEELCVMIVEECRKTLTDSISVALETLVMLSAKLDADSAKSICRHLVTAYPENADILRSSLANWSRSLPRLMQGHDERPKILSLQRISASLQILSGSGVRSSSVTDDLIVALVSGVSNALQDERPKTLEIKSRGAASSDILHTDRDMKRDFGTVLLDHEGQKDMTQQLRHLMTVLGDDPNFSALTRYLTDCVASTEGSARLASFWLVLQLLKGDDKGSWRVDDFLSFGNTEAELLSRSSLLADLQATTLPLLGSVFDEQIDDKHNWKMQALAMECTVMYAQTFPGATYRPELMDTLYPILSFLGSPNMILRTHAITAVDRLAASCQYSSATEMIIDNIDYLVNSVAWKLNTYSLSPEAPQILRMMVRLCGAELIPYLDDLIQSIFAALDSYHGYPEWVEALFTTLRAMVDVSIEKPQLTITEGGTVPLHQKAIHSSSDSGNILGDLRSRKRRRLDFNRPADEPPAKAPHRPWTNRLEGPSFPKTTETEEDLGSTDEENEHMSPMKPAEDEEKKLSKPHNLLLSIASATVPHLASPSPRVRHLLLDLLKNISPLLGRDENSFLPLINTVWPVVVPRLFAAEAINEIEESEDEMAYNVCAAADTITALCTNAGDFMSSRIDDILQQLIRLFRKVRAQTNLAFHATNDFASQIHRGHSESGSDPQESIQGHVNLQLVQQSSLDRTKTSQQEVDRKAHSFQQTTRTSKGQILGSLTDLLCAILSHVQLTLDSGDEIIRVLLPLMEYRNSIRPHLEVYNADAVWLWDQQLQTEWKINDMKDDKPVIRDALQFVGVTVVELEVGGL